MEIRLTPGQHALIRDGIKAGRYQCREDAIHEALAQWESPQNTLIILQDVNSTVDHQLRHPIRPTPLTVMPPCAPLRTPILLLVLTVLWLIQPAQLLSQTYCFQGQLTQEYHSQDYPALRGKEFKVSVFIDPNTPPTANSVGIGPCCSGNGFLAYTLSPWSASTGHKLQITIGTATAYAASGLVRLLSNIELGGPKDRVDVAASLTFPNDILRTTCCPTYHNVVISMEGPPTIWSTPWPVPPPLPSLDLFTSRFRLLNHTSTEIYGGSVATYCHSPQPPLSAPTLIDPVPQLLSGPRISTDPAKLATGGREVAGVATDGVAQVVIRIPARQVGEQITVGLREGLCATTTCINEYGRLFDPTNPPLDVLAARV